MEITTMTLGIDIGRVIISAGGGSHDTSFIGGTAEAALATPPMEGAFDHIARLVEAFSGRAWLVSKCGPRIQERTRRWLEHHRFHEWTGLHPERVVFCLERPQKAEHCERLGITHFIDDRADVLAAMRGRVPHLFLFAAQPDPAAPDWYEPVPDWSHAAAAVLRTVPGASDPAGPAGARW
jgi:hypothetical protein